MTSQHVQREWQAEHDKHEEARLAKERERREYMEKIKRLSKNF